MCACCGLLSIYLPILIRPNSHCAFYQEAFRDEPGITFMPEAAYGRTNRWLTCILVEPHVFGATREDIRLHLEAHNIESRPVWKPLHLQPIFQHCRVVGGRIAEALFDQGLCLPSGSNLSEQELQVIAETLLSTPRQYAVTHHAALPTGMRDQ